MATGNSRRGPGIARHKRQRPHAAVVLLHVIAPECHRRKESRHRREQVADLRLVGTGLRRITAEGNVGRAHEHEFGPEGKHEHGPAVCGLGIHAVVGERSPQRRAPHHEVAALRAAHQPAAGGGRVARKQRDERAVHPGAGGVDDRVGPDLERTAGRRWANPEHAVVAELHLAVRGHLEPRARGRGDLAGVHEQFHREPFGKEQLRIVIEPGEWKGAVVDQRHATAARPHHAMPRPARAGCEQVVEREPDSDRPASPPMPPLPCAGQRLAADQPRRGCPQSAPATLHRKVEGEPADQMRGQSHEPVAFGKAFTDQSNLAVFQIPQAAMDQPGGPGGGAGGDVIAIDHDHACAREREFSGDGGAVDSRSEHDDRCFSCHGRLSSLPPPAVCSSVSLKSS